MRLRLLYEGMDMIYPDNPDNIADAMGDSWSHRAIELLSGAGVSDNIIKRIISWALSNVH